MNLSGLLNPKTQAIKGWMTQLLHDRYSKHEVLLERLGHLLVTNQEVEEFGRLVVDLFEVGYLKCLNDYKTKLDELGVKVSVVPEQPKN